MSDKILIVDDEPFVRQSFADFFEDNQWEPFQAESGEKALEMLSETEPAAAVVDIRLGGMPGETFIRQALKLKRNMVFVICTGSPEYCIPEDLTESACVSPVIFNKPVSGLSELDSELRRMLNLCGKDG